MSLLDRLQESPVLTALGWGIALSILLGVAAATLSYVSRAISSAPPRLRRRFAAILFVASLGLAVDIVSEPILGLAPPVARPQGADVTSRPPAFALATPALTVGSLSKPRWQPILIGLNRGVTVLASIWLATTFVSAGRLIGGFLLVGAIRRRAQPVASPVPTTQLATLSSRLGLCTHVELLESSDVDVPATAGWRRPAVLLPVGLASKLDEDALEIVLAHELVHIRRADYIWGMVQSVGDVLTALSPGHQWLSREGRRLCEDACDDEVVALGIDRTRYARMLESLANWSRGQQLPAAVCAASRNLPSRIRRLVSEVTDAPSRFALVGAGVVFCTAMAIAGLGASLSAQHTPAGAGSSDQARRKAMLPFMFQPEATGVPFRIVNVEPGESFAVDSITVMNIYPKRILSLRVGADIRPNAMPPVDGLILGVRSASIPTGIEPGSTVHLNIRFLTPTERAEFERSLGVGELGMNVYPAFASFEDGSSWVGPSPASVPALTIPRDLISATPPPKAGSGPNDVWTCYDAEAHQTSEGGVAPIREDPSRFVRCTNGRWVETTVR